MPGQYENPRHLGNLAAELPICPVSAGVKGDLSMRFIPSMATCPF